MDILEGMSMKEGRKMRKSRKPHLDNVEVRTGCEGYL